MRSPETILKQIAQQHGITILAQSRLKGLILDMMPKAERKHINVLKRAIDEQIGTKLLEMQHDDPAIRQIKVNTLKEKFKNDNAFDDTALYIVECFSRAIDSFINEKQTLTKESKNKKTTTSRKKGILNKKKNEAIKKKKLNFKGVRIGEQIWANKNLDLSHFQNGDVIFKATSVKAWKEANTSQKPAWCYYQNNLAYGQKYGKLYNRYALNDPRGLAPEGWSIATKKDWEILQKTIRDPNADYYYLKKILPQEVKKILPQDDNNIFNKLQESLKNSWDTLYAKVNNPNVDYDSFEKIFNSDSDEILSAKISDSVAKKLKSRNGWKEAGGGINEYGFNALPGGERDDYGYFYRQGVLAAWWCSDSDQDKAPVFAHLSESLFLGSLGIICNKGYGFSVRCIKNLAI